jgi:hypothetical protein
LRDVIDIPYAQNGVPGVVKIIVPFTDPLMVGRFVFHCHIVEHEDGGMMANVVVLPPGAERDAGGAHAHDDASSSIDTIGASLRRWLADYGVVAANRPSMDLRCPSARRLHKRSSAAFRPPGSKADFQHSLPVHGLRRRPA